MKDEKLIEVAILLTLCWFDKVRLYFQKRIVFVAVEIMLLLLLLLLLLSAVVVLMTGIKQDDLIILVMALLLMTHMVDTTLMD